MANTRQKAVDGRLIRGGTSKGFFVQTGDFPVNLGDEERRDSIVRELFGTPDPLQIDGIGGSHSHTSKLMVVGPSDRNDVDLEYTFAQVGVDKSTVDWSGNCGNLTSAVGHFGILEGLVAPVEPETDLTLYNTNTDTIIEQRVPIERGEPAVQGTFAVDGVPGTGARIDSTFLDPTGGVFGSVLPTGNVNDVVHVDGAKYDVSLLDVTNPCVFIRASDLELRGDELPADLAADADLLEQIELIRGAVCRLLGVVDDVTDAQTETSATPFIALVSPPQSYKCSTQNSVDAADVDITARILTSQTPHHAYAMTGAMCLAAASKIEGTIPNEVVPDDVQGQVTIGHPKGTISVGVSTENGSDGLTVRSVTVNRTARQIMNGTAFYRQVTT